MYNTYGATARIGRFTWNIGSPLFGKYFVDIQTSFGSSNMNTPESFDTKEQAEKYLIGIGFSKG
ncbi:MAG: hypothetical protein NC416_18630 [Eubacterium sp.]|nr:hypothetical protein [Eubacterium sp.]